MDAYFNAGYQDYIKESYECPFTDAAQAALWQEGFDKAGRDDNFATYGPPTPALRWQYSEEDYLEEYGAISHNAD